MALNVSCCKLVVPAFVIDAAGDAEVSDGGAVPTDSGTSDRVPIVSSGSVKNGQHACGVCGFTSRLRASAIAHSRTHTKEKRFFCTHEGCSYGAPRRWQVCVCGCVCAAPMCMLSTSSEGSHDRSVLQCTPESLTTHDVLKNELCGVY